MSLIDIALFTIRKWTRGERYLLAFSSSAGELVAELAGKHVAIVGNARSLRDQTHGAAIDRADLVIRMHAAPLPDVRSHGSKTHWLALAMPVSETLINQRAPGRLLWMAKKRKRVRWRFVSRPGFYLHPKPEWDRMCETLAAPPTTGVMLIELVARSGARKIDLYGFDFFASLSLTGRRTANQVPHDFAAEQRFVERMVEQDARVSLNR